VYVYLCVCLSLTFSLSLPVYLSLFLARTLACVGEIACARIAGKSVWRSRKWSLIVDTTHKRGVGSRGLGWGFKRKKEKRNKFFSQITKLFPLTIT